MAYGVPLWTESMLFPQNSTQHIGVNVEYTKQHCDLSTSHLSLKPKIFTPVVLYQSQNSQIDESRQNLEGPSGKNVYKRRKSAQTVISDDGSDGGYVTPVIDDHLARYNCEKCETFRHNSVNSYDAIHTCSWNPCDVGPFLETDSVFQCSSKRAGRQSIDHYDNVKLRQTGNALASQHQCNQIKSSFMFSHVHNFPPNIFKAHKDLLSLHCSPSTLRLQSENCPYPHLGFGPNESFLPVNSLQDASQSSKSLGASPQMGNLQNLNVLPFFSPMTSMSQHGQHPSAITTDNKSILYREFQSLIGIKNCYLTTYSHAANDITDSNSYQSTAMGQVQNEGIGQGNIKRKDNTPNSRSGSNSSRPYRCHCSRAFARNEELTRHQRIHSGYKPHRCQICSKKFGRKDHLNKHLKTHLHSSQKKVHVCTILNCGQRYTRSDALARHQMNSHGIKARTSKWRPHTVCK